MLSCKDVSKLTSEYLDGNLPFLLRLRVKLHLFICYNCRNFVKQLRTTIATLNQLPAKSLDEDIVLHQAQILSDLCKHGQANHHSDPNPHKNN